MSQKGDHNMREKRSFLLLGTHGCHLCEVAEAMIASGLDGTQISVDYMDIAYDDALLEQYGTRIPVLINEQQKGQELAWPFDQSQLLAFINTRPDSP